jgi:ubiquinone biosynthesis protein COQ9
MQMSPTNPEILRLLDHILPEVPYDGWSQKAFDIAVARAGMDRVLARSLCPRGPVDLAIAYHRKGDAAMVAAIEEADLRDLRFRDRIAFAIRARIDAITDKEVVRRGSALFLLPHLAPDGARLIWGTADLIWNTLGDTTNDLNWYTKRATLSGVYAAAVLYWLGDDSFDTQATDAFIDRRIDEVMQIEKVKAKVRGNPVVKPFVGAIDRLTGMFRPPASAGRGAPPDAPFDATRTEG